MKRNNEKIVILIKSNVSNFVSYFFTAGLLVGTGFGAYAYPIPVLYGTLALGALFTGLIVALKVIDAGSKFKNLRFKL